MGFNSGFKGLRCKVKVKVKVKVKQSHYRLGQTREIQGGEDARLQDSRHMRVVRLSALHTGHLYSPPSQVMLLVLISSRG